MNRTWPPGRCSIHFSFPQGVEAMRLRSIGVLLLGLMLVSFTAATAQERFGALTGKVTDPQDAAIPGVTITVTNKTSGVVHTAVTGSDGVYRIVDLEPGRYQVVAEISGFQKAEDQ